MTNRQIAPIIAELQANVTQRYPDARFEVFEGEDPNGTYLRAIVDVEDIDEVMDLVVDRVIDLQVEEHVPLYFLASRPPQQLLDGPHPATGGQPGTVGRAFLP